MTNIFVLDLTANYLGWEHQSAIDLSNGLVSQFQLPHGISVDVECFEEIRNGLEILEYSKNVFSENSQQIANMNCFLTQSFMSKCSDVNNSIESSDYVNIRCHGYLNERNNTIADIFCANKRNLSSIKEWSNFECLLQNIPNLRQKNIFFTVCYGLKTIDSFIFDGLKVSDREYIATMNPMTSEVSNNLIIQHIKNILEGSDWKGSFDEALQTIKIYYQANIQDKIDQLSSINVEGFDELLIREIAEKRILGNINIFNPSQFIEIEEY